MNRQPILPRRRSEIFWISLSLAVLFACAYYTYVSLAFELTFTLDPATWRVISAEPCAPGHDCIQLHDQVLAIGDVTAQRFAQSRRVQFLDKLTPDGMAEVKVLRRGRPVTLPVQMRHREHSGSESSPYFLSFVFWLMGTGVILFLRPRDERWLLLILFAYVTALWFSAGMASWSHIGGASIVFHVFIWLFLPVSIHLHMILSRTFMSRRLKLVVLVPLYLGALVLIAVDALGAPSGLARVYPFTTLLAFAASFLLIVFRFLFSRAPAERTALRLMLAGIAIGPGTFVFFFGLLPPILARVQEEAGLNIRELYPWVLALAQLPMPLLPMSYIYAIYKHQLGALEFRANRFFGRYSFFTLSTTLFVVVLFLVSSRFSGLNVHYIATVLVASLLFLWGTLALRGRYQALIDRYVFGIKHSPDEIVRLASERIPQSLDRLALARVVTAEILPVLLVRESAAYLLREDGTETIYERGLPEGAQPPARDGLAGLLAVPGPRAPGGITTAAPGLEWVRLVIPLNLQGRTLGGWLLGRRDPDDYYPVPDVQLLQTVANQVATILENIRLYEQAQMEIAQREAAEAAIRRSEERFRTLFEATLEGIAIVRDGVILEANNPLSYILGYAPGELIGRRLSELVAADTEELDGVPHEGKGRRQDGSDVDIEAAGKQYVFQGEDVTVVAVRDIAQRKRDEAENKMLQGQLLHSQKMEAIGRLSAGVAHDFNNCLLAIFGYTDLLRETYSEDPFLARNLSGLREAGQKAAALTKQLLAFARRQPLEARVVELNPIVAGLEKMLRRLLGEDIAFAAELAPNLGRVKVDPGQLEQILINLAVNARDAMPEGGHLTIRTGAVTVTDEVPIPAADIAPGDYNLVTVTDTGTGMEPETLARAFEPFFSTKGEGTGLGLATAYGIVKQSGGHIFADSAPAKGARFSIYLPVTRDSEPTVLRTLPARVATGTETILLVEDEDEVRPVLEQILSGKGYRVLTASSGDEAIATARRYVGVIDLLLTDVTMPRMKGPELAERILALRPETRVVYMSGYNDEAIAETGRICLQKPFSPVTLAQTLRAVLDEPAGGRLSSTVSA
jgi:PAS domain S-box-containing protein